MNTVAEIEDVVKDIQRALKDKDDKIEFLENQIQKGNILVDGIPDDDHRTCSSTEIKVKQVLEEKLDLGFEPDIERARCLGATVHHIMEGHLFQN